jgi:histidinol-phosphate aminotransferase
VDAILDAVTENTKMLFCVLLTTNRKFFSDENVVSLLQNFNGLVVIDEAYIDFSKKVGE